MLCLLGLFGNIVSVVVLRKDRERREALFLLQMLALADAFYILVALFRYPLKYLVPDQELYMDMQVELFSFYFPFCLGVFDSGPSVCLPLMQCLLESGNIPDT